MPASTAGRMVAFVFERIVVGYAGDRPGRDAVVLAAALASPSRAQVCVAFPYQPLFAAVPGDIAEERIHSEVDALLGDDHPLQKARYRSSSASWPIHALHELALEEDAGLIVFGAARERLGRRHPGLMERMVHGAPCAVAVAPDGYVDRPSCALLRVGVGFADTDEGRAALSLARELARRTGGDTRVIAGSGLSPTLSTYAPLSPVLPAVEEEMYSEMKSSVQRVADELDHGKSLQLDVRRGDPNRVLAEASRSLDLLVLGSRGYGPLRHALLGSVSAEVMRSAHCPVLVLPRRTAVAASARAPETVAAPSR